MGEEEFFTNLDPADDEDVDGIGGIGGLGDIFGDCFGEGKLFVTQTLVLQR